MNRCTRHISEWKGLERACRNQAHFPVLSTTCSPLVLFDYVTRSGGERALCAPTPPTHSVVGTGPRKPGLAGLVRALSARAHTHCTMDTCTPPRASAQAAFTTAHA